MPGTSTVRAAKYLQNHLNAFHADGLFLYLLKTSGIRERDKWQQNLKNFLSTNFTGYFVEIKSTSKNTEGPYMQ